ncbi:MAG: hypothetical protein EOP49_16430 [Sphingobacteriales bacterium]|nr:MAG: hypothetical protein EOP49_16430 [Sphingobacteriales bacterium]
MWFIVEEQFGCEVIPSGGFRRCRCPEGLFGSGHHDTRPRKAFLDPSIAVAAASMSCLGPETRVFGSRKALLGEKTAMGRVKQDLLARRWAVPLLILLQNSKVAKAPEMTIHQLRDGKIIADGELPDTGVFFKQLKH